MTSLSLSENTVKLGFGYLRLPKTDGKPDQSLINKMVDKFLSSGGIYFDTAYVYEGSETALRETVVKRHPRESFKIATKLQLDVVGPEMSMEDILDTSMERLGIDYIDSYLIHGINSGSNQKAEKLGAWDHLLKLKAQGLIRHMGFSFHGPPEDLDEILQKHPEAEFVQLQLNYFDWENPKVQSRRLYEIAREHNKPIIVMEPLLGGKLASTDSPAAELFFKADPDASPASWGLRFVAGLDGVIMTLSGMSSYEQMTDNIATFTNFSPLTKDERSVIDKAAGILRSVPRVGCTQCNYCKDCPSNIHIPMLIDVYNDFLIHKTTTNLDRFYYLATVGSGKALDCIACGACERICPQSLPIVETMANISKMFD